MRTSFSIVESFASLRDADFQSAGLIDRAREDGIARLFRDGHRFAGERRLVDGARSFDDHAIERNALARPDNEHIANDEFVDRKQHDDAIAPHKRFVRTQLHQRLDRLARAVDRVGLQHIGEREEEKQHRSLEGRAYDRRSQRRQDHQQINVDCPLPERLQAGLHAKISAREIRAEVKEIVPGHAELCGHPPRDHENEGQRHEDNFQPLAGRPIP